MPPQQQQDPIDILLSLPEDKQLETLRGMTGDERRQIGQLIQQRKSQPSTPAPAPAAPSGGLSPQEIERRRQQVASQASRSYTPPPESTMASRWQAFAETNPFTLENLSRIAQTQGQAGINALLTMMPMIPYSWVPESLRGTSGTPQEAMRQYGAGVLRSVVEPPVDYIQAIRRGDYDAASRAAGQVLFQTVPGVAGAVETAAPGVSRALESSTPAIPYGSLPGVAALKQKAADIGTSVAQRLGGTRAKTITRPFVREAVKGVEEARAADTHNVEIGNMETALDQGGHQLGLDTVEANKQLIGEENQLYEVPNEKMAGRSSAIDDVEFIRDQASQYVQGSNENLKIFKDIKKRAEDYEKSDIASEERQRLANVTIKDLIGYYREAGRILENERLRPDIQQAYTHLRDQLGEMIQEHAKAVGAGEDWRKAQNFHHQRMNIFGDRGQALRAVRDEVEKGSDSKQWWPAFVNSHTGEGAVSGLRNFPTEIPANRAMLNELADDIAGGATRQGQPSLTDLHRSLQDLEEKPVSDIELPTPERVRGRREAKLEATATRSEEFVPTDFRRMGVASGAVGGIMSMFGGHPRLGAGMLSAGSILGLPKLYGTILEKPWFQELATRPTALDLAELEKLPDNIKPQVKQAFQGAVNLARQRGLPIQVSPAFRNWIIGTAAIAGTSSGIQNRADAMNRLGRNPATGELAEPGERRERPKPPALERRTPSGSGPAASIRGLSNAAVQKFADAIARAEGFYISGSVPNRMNNPGDINPGTITRYSTPEEGWRALRSQLQGIYNGSSRNYNPAMTLRQMAMVYARDPNWAINVAGFLGVSPNSTLGEIANVLEQR